MHANNETGAVQDVAALRRAVPRARAFCCTSMRRSRAGKIPIDWLGAGHRPLSFTAHKLYGPKGIGALYVRPRGGDSCSR